MSKPVPHQNRVLTYGTFDLLHFGHVRLLQRARALGTHLVVGLSTDQFNALKGKKSVFSYQNRKRILLALKAVDEVIPERGWDQKLSDLKKYQIDTFVMGDDWAGKFDFLKPHCKVVYLPRTSGISTSHLKEHIRKSQIPASTAFPSG